MYAVKKLPTVHDRVPRNPNTPVPSFVCTHCTRHSFEPPSRLPAMQFSLPSLVLCLSGLTLAQNTTKSSSGSAEELIRNTLATEAFLLDTRELTSLGQVYTDDAKIEWHNLGTTWDGLDTIISTEQSALNNSYTLMHQYTMSLINVYDNGTANATS